MHRLGSSNSLPDDAEDLSLIDRVLAGDRRAFEPLVRRHERRVYRVSLAVLGNVEDAEEAMQDSFVRAFHNLAQFRRESRFSTWLTRIAVNEALRKRSSRKEHLPLTANNSGDDLLLPSRCERWENDPEQLFGKQEVRKIAEDAIRSLPEIYREAFVLRDVEQLSAEEAADALGITIAALKSRLLRGRLILRETLSHKFQQQPGLGRKVVHKAVDAGTVMAMRLMRAMGGQAR
jgi:RNA polymerase sigma-70 factor (ECF subfamily)